MQGFEPNICPLPRYFLNISYVGFVSIHKEIVVNKDLTLKIELEENTLAIGEVTVTAKQNAAGKSTSSQIGRQAIDHIQATSLADVMQLIPGQEMGNADLTAQQNIQIRQLVNNKTSAFGSQIVVDGVPMSNNGNLSQGGFSTTTFDGTDLRQVSADDIESVEVVRGIPSAEYGDLTSGLVIVHSKIGVTPWQVKAKINPGLQNYTVGKGLKLNNKGVLNVNFDYANAWSDPRNKTRNFDRYTLNLSYGQDFTKKWHGETKIRLVNAKDWSGDDPDAKIEGSESENKNNLLSITHNGRISVDKKFSRSINYTIGYSATQSDSYSKSFVVPSGGRTDILTATESGYFQVPFIMASYRGEGKTESRPQNFFVKVSNNFLLKHNDLRQNFKYGLEYKFDVNNGKGYYNYNDSLPLKPNSNGRPRAFSDIPSIHQISAFAEDNLTWKYWGYRQIRFQAGARFTAMQPFDDVSTFAVSPRTNLNVELTKWWDLRFGVGLNSKTPGLDYLYPDAKYTDRIAATYIPQNDLTAQLVVYNTNVYQVKYSENLKNATSTKVELGSDFTLPGKRKLTLIVYRDKTPDGFDAATNWLVYRANYYDINHGLIVTDGQKTTIDYSDPARVDVVFITDGSVGNTNTTINKGVEMDFDFGEIKAIRTSFYLTGAAQSTKTFSSKKDYASPKPLPTDYINGAPIKMVFGGGLDYNQYKKVLTTLRTVTAIPTLRMVASFSGQAIWYNYSKSYIGYQFPEGWLDENLNYHEITDNMHGGFIGMDGKYYQEKPSTISSVKITDQIINDNDNEPTKNPVTWLVSARLTKEFGKTAGLSFYVNNMFFYEPYKHSSKTTTLEQRNTGTFSFGVELFFNL